MSTDVFGIMRRDTRCRTMLNDSELTGETLLFALAADEMIYSRKESSAPLHDWIVAVEEVACGTVSGWWAKEIIRKGIPRYELDRPWIPVSCVALMIRRGGLCGRASGPMFMDRDPETGEARWVGLCSRHRDMRSQYEARKKEWFENGKPSPPPNKGGVLKRYYTTDWNALYRWASPCWELPETEPDPEPAREPAPPQRPTLRLIHGGLVDARDANEQGGIG